MKKLILLSFVILSSFSALVAQCPRCKSALTNSRKNEKQYDRTVGDGINKGILFLMSVPYVLVAGAGFAVYKTQKKKNK